MEQNIVTKEQLIQLWGKACQEKEYSCFNEEGSNEEPYGFITIHKGNSPGNNISLSVSAYIAGTEGVAMQNKYGFAIKAIFDGFVEFCSFQLNKDEFESLISSFNDGQSRALRQKRDEIVKERKNQFEEILKTV